jgi:hypothetical protein
MPAGLGTRWAQRSVCRRGSRVTVMDGFVSAGAKLDRAEGLLSGIETSADAWSRNAPLTMGWKTEPRDGLSVLHAFLADVPAPSSDLLLKLDECLHHLRTSLDHAVWQLVIDGGRLPTSQAFPVLRTPDGKRMRGSTAGISSAARDFIRSVQPHTHEGGYRTSTLWALHHLDIVAKHRSVVPIGGISHRIEFRVPDRHIEGKTVEIGGIGNPLRPREVPILRIVGIPSDYVPPALATWITPTAPELWMPPTEDNDAFALLPQLHTTARWVRKIVRALSQFR